MGAALEQKLSDDSRIPIFCLYIPEPSGIEIKNRLYYNEHSSINNFFGSSKNAWFPMMLRSLAATEKRLGALPESRPANYVKDCNKYVLVAIDSFEHWQPFYVSFSFQSKNVKKF